MKSATERYKVTDETCLDYKTATKPKSKARCSPCLSLFSTLLFLLFTFFTVRRDSGGGWVGVDVVFRRICFERVHVKIKTA